VDSLPLDSIRVARLDMGVVADPVQTVAREKTSKQPPYHVKRNGSLRRRCDYLKCKRV
jgi:hypothetical protein